MSGLKCMFELSSLLSKLELNGVKRLHLGLRGYWEDRDDSNDTCLWKFTWIFHNLKTIKSIDRLDVDLEDYWF